MTSKALRNVLKLNDLVPLSDWFTPQQRADFRSRSLTGDHTTAVQTALNEVEQVGGGYQFTIGDGVVCLTSRLVVDQPISIHGCGVVPYVGAIGSRGGGSWVFLNHADVGFDVDGAGVLGGVQFSGFGTFRAQSNPSAGWTPGAFDFDFDIDNADVLMEDMVLLNPTKGIRLANGLAGRLTMHNIKGQPLQVGIQCDQSLDQVISSDCRFWPYWRDDANVHAYTQQNLDAVWLKRCDVPMFTNFFSFAARAGMRFTETVQGRVSKLQASNVTLDFCKYGLWIDNTVSTGNVLGQFNNLVINGAPGVADTVGVFIQGSGSVVQIDAADIRSVAKQCVRITGTNNDVRFGLVTLDGYNQDASGAAAVDVAAGNVLQFGVQPIFGPGTWLAGAGTIEGLITVQRSSGTTDGFGDITVSHGLGLTPSKVFAQVLGATPYVVTQPHTITSNAFKVRCFDAAGAPITATNLTIQWQAYA